MLPTDVRSVADNGRSQLPRDTSSTFAHLESFCDVHTELQSGMELPLSRLLIRQHHNKAYLMQASEPRLLFGRVGHD